MGMTPLLKAIADETRIKIISLLLKHNYCVRALARNLGLSESTVSQHLKVLREAGLLIGKKRGYFMHYDVERAILYKLAEKIVALADIEREMCTQGVGGCQPSKQAHCHAKGAYSDDTEGCCHGITHGKEDCHHGDCQCHKS